MAKKARRIRYVPRARRRRRRNPGMMGVPNIVWLLGGGLAAFLIIKKLREAKPAAKPAAAITGTIPGTSLQISAQTGTSGSELYADVGGTLASGGMGIFG